MTFHENCCVCHKLGHRKDMYQEHWHTHIGYSAPDAEGNRYYHPECFEDDKDKLIQIGSIEAQNLEWIRVSKQCITPK